MTWFILGLLVMSLQSAPASAQETISVLALPPLRINGQPARAHTQGVEIQADCFYVTARREDVSPKRALLLRTSKRATDWDAWDITPESRTFDHPGGMQSDGKRLWIPIAESRRHGRTIIRAYPLAGMRAGQTIRPEFEMPVDDHIGALAVFTERNMLLGANWDTETAYVWDLSGKLQRSFKGSEMQRRALGVVSGPDARSGLAVQDWKAIENRLFASGLFRGPGADAKQEQSRLFVYADFFEPNVQRGSILLPRQGGTELAGEGMTIAKGYAYFLPDDLGATNRIYRVSTPAIQ